MNENGKRPSRRREQRRAAHRQEMKGFLWLLLAVLAAALIVTLALSQANVSPAMLAL